MIKIDPNHPRYKSLVAREKIVDGVKAGVTSLAGLTAHGRGEAFDYLLGEMTHQFAKTAIDVSAAHLVLAKFPVISVNGNTAALCPNELISLANILNAPLEINLFHPSIEREITIENFLKKRGAKEILKPDGEIISSIRSNRRMISSLGQKKADVVFVPLEDGDRTENLIKIGKKVITIDLNPLSRTSREATVTIVDNILRTMPILLKKVEEFQKKDNHLLQDLISEYSHEIILKESLQKILNNLITLSKEEGL